MRQLKGTVWPRPNGTWTVQGEKEWDPKTNRFVRPSLGTFTTKVEAEVAQVAYTDQVNRDAFALDEAELRKMPVARYLTDWVGLLEREASTGKIARRTYIDYESVVRCHLIPRVGSLTVGSINPSVIRRMLLDVRDTGLSDRTVEKVYRTLHRAFGDSDLASNPVRVPKRHRPRGRTSARKEYPPPQAVREFLVHLASCPGAKQTRVSVPLQLVAVTGLRLAEACGLAWNDVDLAEGTLTVEYTLQAARSELFVKGPKSARGYRTIGLPPGLVESLGAHRASSNEERLRVGSKYTVKPLDRDFVFRGDAFGKPLHPGRLSDGMRREWDHAELTPRTTLHGLRHAVASVLILNGLTVTDVAAHLGDEPNTITLFYQHELNGERRRDTVNKVIGDLYG